MHQRQRISQRMCFRKKLLKEPSGALAAKREAQSKDLKALSKIGEVLEGCLLSTSRSELPSTLVLSIGWDSVFKDIFNTERCI